MAEGGKSLRLGSACVSDVGKEWDRKKLAGAMKNRLNRDNRNSGLCGLILTYFKSFQYSTSGINLDCLGS